MITKSLILNKTLKQITETKYCNKIVNTETNHCNKIVEQNTISLTNCLHNILPQILCFASGLSFLAIVIMENVNKVVNQLPNKSISCEKFCTY